MISFSLLWLLNKCFFKINMGNKKIPNTFLHSYSDIPHSKFNLAVTMTTGCKPLQLLEIEHFLLKLKVQLEKLCKSKVVSVGLEGWELVWLFGRGFGCNSFF